MQRTRARNTHGVFGHLVIYHDEERTKIPYSIIERIDVFRAVGVKLKAVLPGGSFGYPRYGVKEQKVLSQTSNH